MELEVLGWDGLPGSENGFGSLPLNGDTSKQKWATRCECSKQEGSGFCGDAWRASKVARTDAEFSLASTALLLQNSGSLTLKSTSTASACSTDTLVSSDAHMLRVSSRSKPDTSALPYFHMATTHTKNEGYYSGGLNASTGMCLLSGVRGPFTPSQWLELEQQAMIYKYILANEPIPINLLIPIRKAFETAGLYGLNGGNFRTPAWGWGPLHLGYSNSTDPEPGRCRRTDGKKWRCSKDAVANQKYCEKHMNRGRHRSRKHVEGQDNGHSVAGATKSSTVKLMPPSGVASSSVPLVLPGGGSSNSLDINHHNYYQVKGLQPSATNPNVNPFVSRKNSVQGLQDAAKLSFLSQDINLNCSESSLPISKHQNSCEQALNGYVVPSSGSVLDATTQKSYGCSNQREPEPQHSYCTRMDEWPKSHGGADHLNVSCPGLRSQSQSDSTQLSMSVPMCPADFMSSTSSPTNEKDALSPLRLSRELEMGLGVGSQSQSHAQANWRPISWEASMGGPLGEALQGGSISNTTGESRQISTVNLLPKVWDGIGSCQLSSSSPTGVLQKSALVSLSNSSAGSSPRADNSKTIEGGGSLCSDLLGSTNLVQSSPCHL